MQDALALLIAESIGPLRVLTRKTPCPTCKHALECRACGHAPNGMLVVSDEVTSLFECECECA